MRRGTGTGDDINGWLDEDWTQIRTELMRGWAAGGETKRNTGVGDERKNTRNREGAERTVGTRLITEETRCGGEKSLLRSTGGKQRRGHHTNKTKLKRQDRGETSKCTILLNMMHCSRLNHPATCEVVKISQPQMSTAVKCSMNIGASLTTSHVIVKHWQGMLTAQWLIVAKRFHSILVILLSGNGVIYQTCHNNTGHNVIQSLSVWSKWITSFSFLCPAAGKICSDLWRMQTLMVSLLYIHYTVQSTFTSLVIRWSRKLVCGGFRRRIWIPPPSLIHS